MRPRTGRTGRAAWRRDCRRGWRTRSSAWPRSVPPRRRSRPRRGAAAAAKSDSWPDDGAGDPGTPAAAAPADKRSATSPSRKPDHEDQGRLYPGLQRPVRGRCDGQVIVACGLTNSGRRPGRHAAEVAAVAPPRPGAIPREVSAMPAMLAGQPRRLATRRSRPMSHRPAKSMAAPRQSARAPSSRGLVAAWPRSSSAPAIAAATGSQAGGRAGPSARSTGPAASASSCCGGLDHVP